MSTIVPTPEPPGQSRRALTLTDAAATDQPSAWWDGYAAGHRDATAEAAVLVAAAYRAGHAAGRHAAKLVQDAEHTATPTPLADVAAFLSYLAEDPDTTPRPLPPLEHTTRRAAA